LIDEERNRNGIAEREIGIGIGVAGILDDSESNDSTPIPVNSGNGVDDTVDCVTVGDIVTGNVVADAVNVGAVNVVGANGCVTVSVIV
jgi:hypothetical protein